MHDTLAASLAILSLPENMYFFKLLICIRRKAMFCIDSHECLANKQNHFNIILNNAKCRSFGAKPSLAPF